MHAAYTFINSVTTRCMGINFPISSGRDGQNVITLVSQVFNVWSLYTTALILIRVSFSTAVRILAQSWNFYKTRLFCTSTFHMVEYR